jgi:hypothetical protein
MINRSDMHGGVALPGSRHQRFVATVFVVARPPVEK